MANAVGGKRLLVVDDEPLFGELVAGVAEELGYEVTVTTSASAFRDSFESCDPTTVVLDIVMPGEDGIELMRWLAARECTASIVLATGYNPRYAEMAEMMGKARGLGRVRTLTKPVNLADLRAALA